MKSYAYAIDLVPDDELVACYEEHHRAVWPIVLTSLARIGILDMKIFRVGYRMFMYCETVDDFDPNTAFPEYNTFDERIPEWEELMNEFQQVIDCAQEGEKWAAMNEIFNMKEQLEKL